eukprot:6488358-Amphidinium_carterae.1
MNFEVFTHLHHWQKAHQAVTRLRSLAQCPIKERASGTLRPYACFPKIPHMSRFDGQIKELKARFQASDTSGDGRLSYDELARLLKRGKPDMLDRDIRALFDGMDKNHDHKIDFCEFVDFVYTTGKDLVQLEAAQKKKKNAASRTSSAAEIEGLDAPKDWTYYGMGAHPEFAASVELEEIDWETVHTVYEQYSGDNHSMEGAEFMKLCRNARLIAGDFTLGDVDVVFTTVTHGQRHMKKKQFREAIKMVAKKRRVPTSHIRSLIASTENL